MKAPFRNQIKKLFMFCVSFFVAVEAHSSWYGTDPLNPTPESRVGQFLAETRAYHFVRTFAQEEGAGVKRLVVLVSRETFPAFQRLFADQNALFHFHEPHQKNLMVLYQNGRGSMGRLQDSARYTYAGVLMIPILLSDEEASRTELFFSLAKRSSRRSDVVLFPWLLNSGMNDGAQPYCEPRNAKSTSEWFVHLPIGELNPEIPTQAYQIETITDELLKNQISNLWTAPWGRTPLAQQIGLEALMHESSSISPTRIGAALLLDAPIERVPVVFRLTDDAISEFDHQFNPYFAVEEIEKFNLNRQNQTTLKVQ